MKQDQSEKFRYDCAPPDFQAHLMIMPDTHFSEAYRNRFAGIGRLYGEPALEALHNAHFAVAGIGGVGTWVAESLARSGIGQMTLIDMDDICVTNTNRQIHALSSTVGLPKISVMADRLREINPEIRVHCIDDFVSRDNLDTLFDSSMDVVIDAVDAVLVKAALINHCKRTKIPVITVGSAGGKKDPRQIVTGDLSKTVNDPLLAKVRNNLRRLHNFSRNPKRVFSVEAVYSTEQMNYPTAEGGTCQEKSSIDGSAGLDCNSGFGAATMVTGSFGFIAASRAIEKHLVKTGVIKGKN